MNITKDFVTLALKMADNTWYVGLVVLDEDYSVIEYAADWCERVKFSRDENNHVHFEIGGHGPTVIRGVGVFDTPHKGTGKLMFWVGRPYEHYMHMLPGSSITVDFSDVTVSPT